VKLFVMKDIVIIYNINFLNKNYKLVAVDNECVCPIGTVEAEEGCETCHYTC